MRTLLTPLFFFLSLSVVGQIFFEKGYIINSALGTVCFDGAIVRQHLQASLSLLHT